MSILLAFGIQAWWEQRQEQATAAEYLTAVFDEIEENIETVESWHSLWSESFASLLAAQELLAEGLHEDSAAAFVLSLIEGSRDSPPRVTTAIFDEILGSGRIVLIRDLAARRRIMRVYAQMDINLERFADAKGAVDPAYDQIIARKLPAGLIEHTGSDRFFAEGALEAIDIRELAAAIGSDPDMATEIRAQVRFMEEAREYMQVYQNVLLLARDELAPLAAAGN